MTTPWFLRGRLKTRQLLLLVVLADEGNIHRAAQVLSMTQPAASKLLKDLETVLGVQLFERLPRGTRPTVYGETMVRHARVALASLDQAHDEVTALREGRLGQVNVGAISSPGLTLLPLAVSRVKAAHPSLRIGVQIESSDVLMERLAQGKLDLLVARLFAQHDTSALRYVPLADESVQAVVRPGHPLLAREGLALQDLTDAGWIVPPDGSVLRHRFDLMFRQAGLAAPTNLVETTALLFIAKMLAESDMVSLLGSDVCSYFAAHGIVQPLAVELPCAMDAFGLVTRTDRPLSPSAALMLQELQRTAVQVYGSGATAMSTTIA